MADLLANWLNNEIELTKVSFTYSYIMMFSLFKALRRTLQMDSSLVNFCINSINSLISKNFQKSNSFISITGDLICFIRDTVAAKIENF